MSARRSGNVAAQVDAAQEDIATLVRKILVGGDRDGWHDFDTEYKLFSSKFERTEDTACGYDPMLMFFTSGTTGYPKIAQHDYTYALGHYITAKYWHGVHSDGVHFTISDTGWGKALWGKLYGQWLCEGCVLAYDFDRFDAAEHLSFQEVQYNNILRTSNNAARDDKRRPLQIQFSVRKTSTTAGGGAKPEVYHQFLKLTGLHLMEGFGQTETTLSVANLIGQPHKLGSMGKPTPLYDIHLLDSEEQRSVSAKTANLHIKTGGHYLRTV